MEGDLALLVESQAAREFLVQRTEDGERWQLSVRRGLKWVPVRSKRESPRTWASLDTLERFARSIGITALTIEL
ncbi:hypothetical protein G7007_20765 [Pseudomonas entomophila]|nr:hypothetical protein [Pseudomonas entomophila]